MSFKNNWSVLVVSCWLLAGSFCNAQKVGILRGVITDSSGKEKIAGAAIYDINNFSSFSSSNQDGNYELYLNPGNHKIVCSMLGMKADTVDILVESSGIKQQNFILHYEDWVKMQTMVVSAGRYEQKLQDVTVSMAVLKPSIIDSKNSTNIKEVLDDAPGLNILDGEPQIRGGSGFDFGIGSRVAILIDGLPILPGDGGRIAWDLLPIENIDQIEIIKGASSVTYGSSALCGSINIRTAYPTDVPSVSVAAYSGIYDSPPIQGAKWWNGNASFSGTDFLYSSKIGQFDVVLGGMALYDHGYIGPPIYEPILGKANGIPISQNDMGEKTERINFGLRYHPKKIPNLNFGLNGNFGESTNVLSLIWSNDSSGLYRAYPNTVILQDQKMLYLDPYITFYTSNGFEHSLRGRLFYTDNIITNNPSNQTTVGYAEYQCIKIFYELGGLNVTAGLVMNQAWTQSDSLRYLGLFLPASNNTLRNYAAYTQIDKKFFKVLNISVGFREEDYITDNGNNAMQPVFRSGLNLQVARATFLRSSFGQGYRYPTLTEKYLNSQFSDLSIFANPVLRPETSWNAEFGIKQGFKVGNFMGFLDVAGFWQEYQNTIELTYGAWGKTPNPYIPGYYNLNYGFQYLNTGPTRVRGIDASITGEGAITKNLKIDILGGYTYVLPQALQPSFVYATDSAHTKLSYESTSSNTENNVLKYRFQNIAKLYVEVKYKKVFIGGNWTYYSFMQNIDTVFYQLASLAAYGIQQYRETNDKGINVFDAHAGLQMTKNFKIDFVVNNVYNLSYSLRPLKIESPRTFAVRVSFKTG